MEHVKKRFRSYIIQSLVILCTVMAIIGTIFSVKTFAQEAQDDNAVYQTLSHEKAEVAKFGLIAASIAFGLGAIGAGIAISHVGAAAMGAIAEKPEIAGQALIFVALAEGLVVFGFITALMILGKV